LNRGRIALKYVVDYFNSPGRLQIRLNVMDPRRFRSDAPGRVVSIESHGGWAFEPAGLPPAWEFPPALWPLLANVKQFLGELEGVGRSLKNPSVLIRPLVNREAIDSSTIEGTHATPRDLVLSRLDPDDREQGPTREVANYTVALDAAIAGEYPITFETICRMHRILLTGTRGESRGAGRVRDVQVAIGNRSRFVPPPPSSLPALLRNFDTALSRPISVDPLIDAFLAHYQFEAIHPFADGNGRVGRALLALTIFRRCGFSKPWLYLSGYFERHRQRYVDRLFRVSTHGDWDSWIEFCLQAAHAQATRTLQQFQQMTALQDDFQQRITTINGSVRLQQVLGLLFEQEFLRVTRLRDELHVTYPTADSDVAKLVELGILRQIAGITPKTFYSPELYRITYEGEIEPHNKVKK
jgi:Fic family protein